jgi:hypothetical protein
MLVTCIVVIVLWPSLLFGQDATIIVRLVNGKNGKPITDENLNVFINNGAPALGLTRWLRRFHRCSEE